MVIFLTSDVGATKKENGSRVSTILNNTNGFINNLQDVIQNCDTFVFVASNPNSYSTNDDFAKLTFESFKMSGFPFSRLMVVDNRTKGDIENIIKAADLVFLAGGDTHTQNRFVLNINLGEILKKYSPIIIGQSAGSVNLAENVYCSPEDEKDLTIPRYFKGLGLTDINIEPHFSNSPHFAEKNILQIELLEDSRKKSFYAITDGSYIIDNGESKILYGEGYLFKNGSYIQICENNMKSKLKSYDNSHVK